MVGFESDFAGSVAHSNDFAGIDFLNRRKAGGEKLAEVFQTVGGGLEDHDGDRSASQVWLISKVCVQGPAQPAS